MTTASPIDPSRLLLTGENPYIRLSATDDGPCNQRRQLLAHPVLAGRAGARSFPAERADQQRAEDLHRQHTDDALAAGRDPGTHQRHLWQPGDTGNGCVLPQFGRPSVVLDGICERRR